MKRGEVYWAELAPRSGSEQSGRRPVLLVSHDGFHSSSSWRSLIVVPITTALQHRSPTTVLLPKGTANLPRECLALGHQITTLDRGKFVAVVGLMPGHQLTLIERAILHALAI